jgi:hypothetical protein
MNARSLTLPSSLLIVATLVACGDSTNNGLNQDTGVTPTPDTGSQGDAGTDDASDVAVTTDAGESDGSGTDASADATPDAVDPATDEYISCTDTADCEGGSQCVGGVCIIPPQAAALLAEEIDTVEDDGTITTTITERPDAAFDFSCFSDGSIYATPEGPATSTVAGIVERFGSGPATNGLCVSIYREDALLPWLSNGECSQLDSDADEANYIACYQLDACRCDAWAAGDDDGEIAAMVDAANRALETAGSDFEIAEGSLEGCYAFIGNCIDITDPELKGICEGRVAANSGLSDATTLIFGHTVSTENEDGSEFAQFSIDNVPTNTIFAYKTSGRESRWRDAWEYGLYTRADLVVDGSMRIDTNAVSASTWQTIPPAVGFAGGIDDLNGAVAGAIRDCGVEGGRAPWNVVHATAGFSFISAQTRLAYFNGNPNNRLPAGGRIDSNIDGLFAAINLPPGPNRVSSMACTANCEPGASNPTYVAIGARNVFQTPKSVIIATFEGITVPR